VSTDLTLALRLADEAAAMALSAVDRHLSVWRKPDGSPATELDVAIERHLRTVLAAERPGDGVLGEECGRLPGHTGREWILDPLDGTARLLAGRPDWGSHIALREGDGNGPVTVAVLTRPTVRRRWWAATGHGAWTAAANGPRRLRVSTVADLGRARVGGLLEPGSAHREALRGHTAWAADEVSLVGAFLEGRVDAVVDDAGDPWDLAPVTLLATEAGGRFTDPAGGRRLDLGGALYSNGPLHDELSRLLSPAYGRSDLWQPF
jgi:histidinol-phosphatase